MRLGWLEDSLTCNNRKPLNEVDEKYTWEIEHAEKVLKKRKEKQLAARKERLHAQRAEAREAYDADMYDRARVSSDDKSKTGKMRQVIDCGRLKHTVSASGGIVLISSLWHRHQV